MAVFYQLLSEITRGTFTCAVATAAYRSGSRLTLSIADQKEIIPSEYSFDYSTKTGIAFSQVMSPQEFPSWVQDRQKLWQKVEESDLDFNALLAREFILALPEELTTDQNIELIKDFSQTSFVSRGMIADVNFHKDHENNPHLHIMCPVRSLHKEENGDYHFAEKKKEWGSKSLISSIRREQAQVINKYLEKYGHSSRVSHLPDKMRRFDCLRPWL